MPLRTVKDKSKGTGTRAPVADKYVSGVDRWSGRGRSPKWVEAILQQRGITLDQFKASTDWLI